MKRFITLIPALLLVFIAVSFAGSPAVHAQTSKQALNCFNKYDGKQYSNDSDELKAFNKTDCANRTDGSCFAASITGSGQYLEVQCTKRPGTNGDRNKKPTAGTGVTDDALSADANCNQDSCNLITNYLNPFITLLSVLVGIAVVIGIIIGAIQVITSAGDPQKSASGKNHIRNALIGAVAYVILYVFLQWLIPGGLL